MNKSKIQYIGIAGASHLIFELLTDPDRLEYWQKAYQESLLEGKDWISNALRDMEAERRRIYGISSIEVELLRRRHTVA